MRLTDKRRDDRGGTESGQVRLPPDHTQAILEVTKEIGAALKTSGRPFALVGSVAAYAHGIPVRLQHDTDFALLRADGETVVELLRERGVQIVDPPEDWLIKARAGGEQVDLIFALPAGPSAPNCSPGPGRSPSTPSTCR
ncbi:hypothetical protein GCM10019017_24850 [Streptomyces showdoensis]